MSLSYPRLQTTAENFDDVTILWQCRVLSMSQILLTLFSQAYNEDSLLSFI